MDMATNASVLVEATQPMGLLITNGEFTAFASPDWLDHSTIDQFQPMHVKVLPGNTGSVRFANIAFWGPANQTADGHMWDSMHLQLLGRGGHGHVCTDGKR
jgi:hypothetical protein